MMGNIGKLLRLNMLKLTSLRTILVLYTACLLVLAVVDRQGQVAALGYFIFIYLWVYGPVGYGGDMLSASLPVSRREVVLGRYVFSMCGVLGAALVIGVIQSILRRDALLISAGMLFCAGTLFIAIVLPPLMYFGPVKARYFVMGIYVVGIAASFALSAVAESFSVVRIPSGAASVCFALGLAVVSCMISLRLFDKREFTD